MLKAKLTPVGRLSAKLTGNSGLKGVLSGGLGKSLPNYEGPYEVTPTRETQVLNTANRSMLDNVVINPIPPNYGLITWNGSYLIVS